MDDFDLITECVGGNPDAWRELVERHSEAVRAVIVKLLDQIPEAQRTRLNADALTVDVFNSLLEDDQRRLRQVGESCDLGAWLGLIARRLTLKKSHQSMRMKSGSGADHAASPQDRSRQQFRDEIAELPARDQLIMQLFFLERIPPARIAAHIGVTETKLKKFLSLALERLRDNIDA